jgi:branched-chain amino acid transport system permease protein
MDYVYYVLTIACFNAVLATSLDLSAGRLGLVSLAHAAFFGIGAYIVGISAKMGCLSPAAALCVASMASGGLAALVAVASVRLRGDFFVIGTFALQMVFLSVATNWINVTGGPTGIPAIPHPEAIAEVFRTGPWSTLAGFGLLGSVILAYRRIDRGSVARGLQAVRDSEEFARSLGVRTSLLKVKATVLSGSVAGFVGGLYAYYVGFIAPAQFGVGESILLLTMVILGGANSVVGPALGAVLLVLVPEALRFLGLPGPVAGNLRQIFYGAVLVILVVRWPRGLVGRYEFKA